MRPASLQRVADKDLAEFIAICISPRPERPRARNLLKHPYFDSMRQEKCAHKLSTEALAAHGCSTADLAAGLAASRASSSASSSLSAAGSSSAGVCCLPSHPRSSAPVWTPEFCLTGCLPACLPCICCEIQVTVMANAGRGMQCARCISVLSLTPSASLVQTHVSPVLM